jgi:OOP family OmpA-OmpF porin
MLHSLQYRVEQVFLVHRRTSLVIRHVQLPSTRGQDPDLVSAMLSAIQDFIHLSFDSGEYARLHVVQAGDLTIWIEQGPLAFLAAAIRGSPPLELRIQFRSVLDEIHAKYSSELQNFQGDAAPFEPAAELLESCLVFRLTEQPEKKKKPVFALSFCAMVAMLVAVASLLFVIEAQRWTAYVAQLNKEPGIHVTSAQSGLWQHSISGLRDPLGADPMQILRNTAVDPKKVRADWRPYLSAAPELVLLRARRRLNPPAGAALAFDAGTLRAFGVAPPAWTAAAEKSALSIPGVERFDGAGIESPEQRQFEKLKASIETPIVFDSGSAVLTPQLAEVAQNAAASLGELTKLADTAGKTLQVRVVGHPDMDGVGRENPALGRKRAQAVAAILKSHGIESDLFDVIGVGTTQPPGQGISEEDKAYNRSVVIRVTWKDRSSDQGSNP